MAILKSINRNHDDLSDDAFWNKEKWENFKLTQPKSWTYLTLNIKIRYIDKLDTAEELLSTLTEDIAPNKAVFHLNLINSSDLSEEDWLATIFEFYTDQIKSKKFVFDKVQYFKLKDRNEIFQPFNSEMGRLQKLFNLKIVRVTRKHDFVNGKLFILENQTSPKSQEILLKQAKEKNVEKHNDRISRLEKADHDMSNILEMGYANIRRNHYSVNSNFNKSGQIIVTDENIILVRRKFRLFGISLLSLIPLLAFARPANKIILVIRIFMEYLRIPLQFLKGLKPILSAALPAIGGIVISTSFVNLDKVNSFLDKIASISWLSPFSFGLNFFVRNPEAIPVAFGLFTGFRILIRRLLPRGEELVILPHSSCKMLIVKGSELIGRWEVKGSKTVKANKGIQYRIAIRDFASRGDPLGNEKLAMNISSIILRDIPINNNKKQTTSNLVESE